MKLRKMSFKKTYVKSQNKKLFGKSIPSLKRLLILIPSIFIVFIFTYTLVEYLTFDPENLKFPTLSSKIYDKDNQLLYEISKDNSVKNTPVEFDQVPKSCIDAIVATEDRSFWGNIGVDAKGLARLMISLATANQAGVGGGSTISQQVIKTAYQRIYDRTPLDKVNEIISAIKLNQTYSKEEIMMMYLNNIYFGKLNYGVEAASQDYFGKSISELNEAECSYLMGIPQWPGIYNPYTSVERGKERQEIVLISMVNAGYITSEEKETLYSEPLNFAFQALEVRAPHYIQYLQDTYGIMSEKSNSSEEEVLNSIDWDSSLDIYTTYDYNIHKKALEIAKSKVDASQVNNINNAAIVVLGKDEELLTMVGSVDFFNDAIDGKFNSALGKRQPGTALIPLIHTIGINEGFNINSYYPNLPFQANLSVKQSDGEVKEELIQIQNFNDFPTSSVTLENALKYNLVIPTVRLTQDIRTKHIEENLAKFKIERNGIEEWCSEISILEGCEVSLLNLTQGYSLLNNEGNDSITEMISKVETINTKDILFKESPSENIIPIDDSGFQKALAEVSEILLSTEQNGWIIRTGDVRNNKDTFAIGINENYTIGVWAGNTRGQALNNANSNTVAVPILHELISYLNTH
jgi:membrane peptidoglycan carboxypeptidase